MNPLTLRFSPAPDWPSRLLLAAGLVLVLGSVPGTATAADVASQMEIGKLLFIQGAKPACALCHTLQAAGAEGAIGPVLDELKPDAERVAKALRNGLGQMPSFKEQLTEAQIAALALYVSKASGGAK